MELPPFMLEHWLNRYHFAGPPVEYDLASSTGPPWTLRELIGMVDEEERQRLFDVTLLYTPGAGSDALRGAIAEMQRVEPDDIQILTGAGEALLILFFLAAEAGANVVLPDPGYPPMVEIPRSLGLEVRSYHLESGTGYRIDPGEVTRLVDDHTRMILVNSPHNPTGAIVSDDEMRFLHDFATERGVQFVVDEVYHPIYHQQETQSAARLANATVLGDLSKALCLSGLRVGWIVERDPKRRQSYFDARAYFTISNTSLGEALATIAIQHRDKILARTRETAGGNLLLLDDFFEAQSDLFGWVRPRGGMTAFPWLKNDIDSRPFCTALAEKGVLLAPGDCFGRPAHFRLGFGASGDRFSRGLTRFAEFLESYSAQRHR